jgi:hypothetical protein
MAGCTARLFHISIMASATSPCYFTLQTSCRQETERDVLVDVIEVFEDSCEVSFMVWFTWNSMVGTFYVQSHCLSARRGVSNLERRGLLRDVQLWIN